MWSDITEMLPFSEGFLDKLELFVIEIPDCLFQVSHLTVDELATFAGSPAAEAISFDQSHFQISCDGIQRNPSPCCSASNGEEVVNVLIARRFFLSWILAKGIQSTPPESRNVFLS